MKLRSPIMSMMVVLLLVCLDASAQCPDPQNPKLFNKLGLLPASINQIKPDAEASLAVPFFVPDEASNVKLTIYSADGDIVRTLMQDKLQKGEHEMIWNGLDEQGRPVPDEAYTPVLSAMIGGIERIDDPREYSGGEIIRDISSDWRFSGQSNISFNLPAPARVLARVIIDNGPVVKRIAHWQPKAAGRVVMRWDGYDQDGIVNVSQRDDLNVLVMGYCLPNHAILTFGSNVDYHDYRAQNGFPRKIENASSAPLKRGEYRLAKDYFLPRVDHPEIALSLPDSVQKNTNNAYVIDDKTNLKITIPQEQRWLIESALYEISFYHDYQFVQEEELGYLPTYWPIDPADFTPGNHLVTVQVSAFNGVFISKTIAIEVVK